MLGTQVIVSSTLHCN